MNQVHTMRDVKRDAKSFVSDPSHESRVIEQFFSSLDTPKSLAACLLYKYGEHKQLLGLDIDPHDYHLDNVDRFHRDYQAVKFLSKHSGLNTGYDLKANAIAKFLQMEEQCKQTNSRFKSYADLEKSAYADWLFSLRRKIDLILGEFCVEELFEKSSWGPGVSTLVKGEDVSATRKFQSETGITDEWYALVRSALPAAYPLWFEEECESNSLFTMEVGNTIITVPKNSKTDRVIAVEPGLNLYFQKGVGAMIKTRLRAVGVNLTDQRTNQRLAKLGSKTGDLATVDFSSASDSIAWAVVHKLFPERWFTVLNGLRCKRGKLGDQVIEWEKFSSMGNGFTFELESLIFYAAALVACDYANCGSFSVNVYGDDVIINKQAYHLYVNFCEFLGFTVNSEKSYATSWFRESCGSYFFNGFDVKPIFHKEKLSNVLSVYKLANSIRGLARRFGLNNHCDMRFRSTWRLVLQGLPNTLRSVKIPYGQGDGGIHSNFDESTPVIFRNKNYESRPHVNGDGYSGYAFICLAERSVLKPQDCRGLLLERLVGIQGTHLEHLNRRETSDVPSPLSVRSIGSHVRASTRLTVDEHFGNSLKEYSKSLHGLSDLAYGNDTALRGRVRISSNTSFVFSWYNLGEWI